MSIDLEALLLFPISPPAPLIIAAPVFLFFSPSSFSALFSTPPPPSYFFVSSSISHFLCTSCPLYFVEVSCSPGACGGGLSPQVSSASQSRALASKDTSQGKVSSLLILPTITTSSPPFCVSSHSLSVPRFYSFDCFVFCCFFLTLSGTKDSGKRRFISQRSFTGSAPAAFLCTFKHDYSVKN